MGSILKLPMMGSKDELSETLRRDSGEGASRQMIFWQCRVTAVHFSLNGRSGTMIALATNSIAQIAADVGYESEAAFTAPSSGSPA
jgi:hypothetical protein